MSSLERIFKRISTPDAKKTALKKKQLKGYVPSMVDRKNLMIILKRKYKRDVNPDISDVELLRMYLHLLYDEEVKAQKLAKQKKRAEQLAKTNTKLSSNVHYVKLVR
jgi:hypothetical protein